MEHQATRGRLVPDAELRRFDAVMPTPFGAVGIRTEALGTEDECIAEILYLPSDVREVPPKNRLAREACAQIKRYLDDPSQGFALPLKPVGTRYQRRVWERSPRFRPGACAATARWRRTSARARARSARRAVRTTSRSRFRATASIASGGIGGFARNDDGFHIAIKRWLLAHEGIRLPA